MIEDIEITGVGVVLAPGERPQAQGSEDVESVVDGDDYHVVRGCEVGAVVEGIRAAAAEVGAAVDIDHNGESVVRLRLTPDVEGEAVLALLVQGRELDLVALLHGRAAEGVANLQIVAVVKTFRRSPAPFSYGGFGVGDAEERLDAVFYGDGFLDPRPCLYLH